MIELALMDPSKETDNKLRWQAEIEGVQFKLYIPKRRVPRPWPKRIRVRISELHTKAERAVGRAMLEDLKRPIVAIVDKVAEHTQTVRFRPQGDPNNWEIGEPYIPNNLLPNPNVNALRVEVQWDDSAGHWPDD